MSKAPFTFVGLAVVCLLAGFGVGTLHYSEEINTKDAQLKSKDAELARYQVVLGIKPGSPGALVELNNQELALKAQSIVAKLRHYDSVLDAKGKEINDQLAAKKISEKQADNARLDAVQEVSRDFDANLATDAYNVENELRTRLGPDALSHVIMVPGFVLKDANGAVNPRSRITFPQLMRGNAFDAMWLGRLADEIDQMANLLPPDSAKR